MSVIDDKYDELGGSAGFLGQAINAESVTPDGVGRFRHFQGGSIYWHPSTGAHEVHGRIRDKWSSMGWERSLLGYPTTDETSTPNGEGRFNHFQGGSIYWTPHTDAHEVHGSIRYRWTTLGWENSFLEFPITDETLTPDGKGRFNHFQGGSIYWSPETGAHEVHGIIRDKWSSMGWERSFLGYPVTDEKETPDGKGRFNHFQGGSIYWTPQTEAHEVHGAIRNLWATLGWEKSYLGYPICDELAPPGTLRCQRFQGGSILYTPEYGAREIPGAETRYIIGIDKFKIDCTRAQNMDTDHVKIGLKIGNKIISDFPVKHMGDVRDGEHFVNLYFDPFVIPSLDTEIIFNYIISNIGCTGDVSAIENGLKAAAEAGLTAIGVPIAGAIVAIAGQIYHFFNPCCDGPVAIDQIYTSGHLINAWTQNSRIYSDTKYHRFQSQRFCGADSKYWVTWSVIRL